jgi:hypothetical protein
VRERASSPAAAPLATWSETIIASPDEALVIDGASHDVADHDAMLILPEPPGDPLLVDHVRADSRAMDDFAVEGRARVEDTSKVCAELLVTSCDDCAARVFDDAVG